MLFYHPIQGLVVQSLFLLSTHLLSKTVNPHLCQSLAKCQYCCWTLLNSVRPLAKIIVCVQFSDTSSSRLRVNSQIYGLIMQTNKPSDQIWVRKIQRRSHRICLQANERHDTQFPFHIRSVVPSSLPPVTTWIIRGVLKIFFLRGRLHCGWWFSLGGGGGGGGGGTRQNKASGVSK